MKSEKVFNFFDLHYLFTKSKTEKQKNEIRRVLIFNCKSKIKKMKSEKCLISLICTKNIKKGKKK